MLKKTAIAVAAAALMLGVVSTAQASKDDNGDYTGGSQFGPLPGQVYAHGWVPGGYYAPRIYGRAFGYAPSPYAVGLPRTSALHEWKGRVRRADWPVVSQIASW
jgi:hypothetical protein